MTPPHLEIGPLDRTAWIHSALAAHERSLVRYATRLLDGDLDRARDVVQEAFLRLCKEEQEDVRGHEAEWLCTSSWSKRLPLL